jgi:hypothetical protein
MSNLEQARAEAAEHRSTFLRLHRHCCEAFGAYCESMGRVQALTSRLHQPLLGGNVEAENKLKALLIQEPPLRALEREGFEVTRAWGWNLSSDVVPMVKRT